MVGVRHWTLWHRSRRVVVFLLGMEAIAVVGFVFAFLASSTPTEQQWLQWLVLAGCGTFHVQLTRREQERRRNRSGTVLIDFVGIWVFPAILLLPATLTVLLVIVIRLQRWFVSRRPVHNFVFSSVSHAVAAALAQVSYSALGPHDWASLTVASAFPEFGTIVVAAVLYEVIQILFVGGVLAMGAASPNPSVRTVLGNAEDNLIEAVTTGLGAATAVLLVTMPPLVGVMALVSVVFNRFSELGQLQDDVRTDVKTAVLNMRGWSESAERELHRTARARGSLAMLMIDLDHFKWINDVFGHPAGDEALLATARTLRETTRPSDLIGRFGGEEFLVLLPETAAEQAWLAAERIRERIAQLRISTTGKRGGPVVITERTVSVGVAIFPEHGDTLQALTQAADAAVYEAKEAGRNRVHMAGAHQARQSQPPEIG